MARAVTPIKTVKAAAKGRKQTGSAATAVAAPKAKSSKPGAGAKPAIVAKGAAAGSVPLGQVSKGELRAQIEKLEQANTNLRAKIRAAGREAKLSATRIAELEKQAAELERRLKPKAEPVASPEKASKPKSSRKQGLKASPGTGAAPGADNAKNKPLDKDADTAGKTEAEWGANA